MSADRSQFVGLHAACRAFLRGEDAAHSQQDHSQQDHSQQAHSQQCPTCAGLLAARPVFGRAMANVPLPAELRSRAMVERVLESVIAQAESSPLGAALEETLTVANSLPSAAEAAGNGSEAADLLAAMPLQESPVAGRLAGHLAASALIDEPAWRSVQASIYGRVRAEAASRRRLWPLGAVGAAAAAVLFLMLMRESPAERPEIVFADLTALPNVDFAILRYGPPR